MCHRCEFYPVNLHAGQFSWTWAHALIAYNVSLSSTLDCIQSFGVSCYPLKAKRLNFWTSPGISSLDIFPSYVCLCFYRSICKTFGKIEARESNCNKSHLQQFCAEIIWIIALSDLGSSPTGLYCTTQISHNQSSCLARLLTPYNLRQESSIAHGVYKYLLEPVYMAHFWVYFLWIVNASKLLAGLMAEKNNIAG